jgi:hypothetical protein
MKPLLYDPEDMEKEDRDEAYEPRAEEDEGMAVQSIFESGDPISGLLLLLLTFGDRKENDEVAEGDGEDVSGWIGDWGGGVAREAADPDPLDRELVLETGLVAPPSGLTGLILRCS